MENVVRLHPSEQVRLDHDRVAVLFRKIPAREAEDLVDRAVEELAQRLAQAQVLWRHRDWPALRKSVRSVIGIADQVGMVALSAVCQNVIASIDAGEGVAIAATVDRLLRVGDASLNAVWDMHDLSL